MGRILGRVEFGAGEPDRYFIHDDTSGCSIPVLFAEAGEAWRIYDQGEHDALRTAVPATNTTVRVILMSLAYGRSFDTTGETYGEPVFGLATLDRLLLPLSTEFGQPDYSLRQANEALHLVEMRDGGFGIGYYDQPLCSLRLDEGADGRGFGLKEMFGKSLNLCQQCAEALLGPRP